MIQEVEESVVVALPEASAPKVSVDPCPHPLPVPATPPKPPPSQQAAPQTPASEGKRKPEPPAEVIEVPKALPAERADQRRMLVEMCVRALFLCLGRFPQHYKSLYRLAFFYTNSKTHQVSPPLLTDGLILAAFQRPSRPLNLSRTPVITVPCHQCRHLQKMGLARNSSDFLRSHTDLPRSLCKK